MPSSLPAFQYKPIDAKNDIRILVLHPSDSFDDPLEVHLESQPLIKSTIALEEVPGLYEAVSYCWGAAVKEDQLLKVTENVLTLLQYLRKRVRIRKIWLDPMCINQDDIEEKSFQIELMDEIFSGAIKVHAWLGEPWDLEIVETLFTGIVVLVQTGDEFNRLGEYSSECDKALFRLFVDLFGVPWFRRRWILQEIVLAHNIVVRCGPYKVPWSLLVKAFGSHLHLIRSQISSEEQESSFQQSSLHDQNKSEIPRSSNSIVALSF